MGGFRLNGPAGVTESLTMVDDGTLNRQETSRPGTVAASVPWDYNAFQTWALSESIIGADAIDAKAWWGDYKDESKLSGDFLRMYLKHKIDPATIAAAGDEIGASELWEVLGEDTETGIEEALKKTGRIPTATELSGIARAHLQHVYKTQGIAFRGPLNPVIGGIEGIDVIEPTTTNVQGGPGPGKKKISYTLNVQIKDKYKFLGNRRSGGAKGTIADQSDYDNQRQRWAQFLLKGEYGTVFVEYHKAFYFGSKQTRTGYAFASLMYAIEAAGMTPGPLEWSVTIPLKGEVEVDVK
jgi:hypothetical protein